MKTTAKIMTVLGLLVLSLGGLAQAGTPIVVNNPSFEIAADGVNTVPGHTGYDGILDWSFNYPVGNDSLGWVGVDVQCPYADSAHCHRWPGSDGGVVYSYLQNTGTNAYQVLDLHNSDANGVIVEGRKYTLTYDAMGWDGDEHVASLFYVEDVCYPDVNHNELASKSYPLVYIERALEDCEGESNLDDLDECPDWNYDLTVTFVAESGADCIGKTLGIKITALPPGSYTFIDNIRVEWSWASTAYDPDPPDGAEDVNYLGVTLSWLPGLWAVNDVNGHEVYFGTSLADVEDANTNTAGIYRGTGVGVVSGPDGNDRYSYVVPGGDLPLTLGQTYFWRIDEVNDDYVGPVPTPWKGDIWSFTTARVLYVDADAPGANDGTSWADAFNYLQDALSAASSGDQILVAEGTYKPDEDDAHHPDGTGEREATFQLKNGVAIYGGYAGFGEPDPNARDVELYKTILSGDLDGDDVDVNDPYDLLFEPTLAENSYHVVTGSETDQTAVLNGFSITAGNANGPWQEVQDGGGMYNNNSSPTLTNCTFSDNSAWSGGGMKNSNSSPTVTNCTFTGNSAYSEFGGGGLGGGMGNFDYSSPTITGCIISNNSSSNAGGGIFSWRRSSPTISNCTINDNRSMGGGGICCWWESSPTITNSTLSGNSAQHGGAIYCQDSILTIHNCVISGNIAEDGTEFSEFSDGGAILCSGGSSTISSCTITGNSAGHGGGGIASWADDTTVSNCILWANQARQGLELYFGYDSNAWVSCSNVQGGWPGIGNIDADPYFVEPGYWDPNGTLTDANDDFWVDGDYHLLPSSPCIDAGDNTAVPADTADLDGDGNTAEPLPFDLDGNPRFVDRPDIEDTGNGTPPIVDMGAYEAMVSCFGVNHVKLGTKAGKKGNKVEVKGTFDPALPIDFAVDDVTYIIDDGLDYMLTFIIPAGSFEAEGKPHKQKFRFHSAKGSQPGIKAKFDFLKCKFELKVKGVMDTSEITAETLAIVLQAGANLVEEVVQVQAKPKHLEFKREPKLNCCQM